MKKIFLCLIVSLSFSAGAYSQETEILKTIDDYIVKVQNEWKIPGLSVSIVKDGRMIMAKGYGVRELGGDNTPVDENTIYHVGSISKSFTATVMATLVDEGLVSWEDTVKNILPDFEWYDKWVEENMQVKDLMTHKTGLKGQQGTYIPNAGYDRDDIYRMFRLMKPQYSFRSTYAYNNMTFIIAEKIIEKVTGKSWEENVTERIFEPLGMTSSNLNGEGYLEAGNRASVAHEFYYRNDTMKVVPLYGEERALYWETVIGPAGGVNSNAVDMAKYAQFHLDMGKVGDSTIVSEKNMNFLHRGQTITSQTDDMIRLYGHCWYVEQNRKYRLLYHTGTTWGFTALCGYVPQMNFGMVILVNSEAPSDPRFAIMRRAIDLFLGDTAGKDYNAEYIAQWWKDNRSAASEEEKIVAETPADTITPSGKALVGRYKKEEPFGNAAITEEDGQLYITVGKRGWKHPLTHVCGPEYSFRSDGHTFPVTFQLNKKRTKAVSFELDFGEEEEFGPWIRK